MATLRNKTKLAALNKENCEEHPSSNQARNSSVPRSQEGYITRVSKEIEGKVTTEMSQEFSMTEKCILGALSRLDDCRRPETHIAPTREQMKTTPRVIFILKQASSATGWHKTLAQEMATTWWQEFMRKSHTAPPVHNQESRKNHSTSQPQLCSENTPVKIEADQILLALQQLANNNSANFHNNINRISKFPKTLTTTMPTFDGKCEKFELFDGLFQTSLKNHNEMTEDDRINFFHSLILGDALQTLKSINGPTREDLGEILAVFRRKYVKPQSMGTAKHEFQKLVVNRATQN